MYFNYTVDRKPLQEGGFALPVDGGNCENCYNSKFVIICNFSITSETSPLRSR